MPKVFFSCTTHFREEAGKHPDEFGVKWDGDKNRETVQGGDGGGGGDGLLQGLQGLLQAPGTDMKAPPLR